MTEKEENLESLIDELFAKIDTVERLVNGRVEVEDKVIVIDDKTFLREEGDSND